MKILLFEYITGGGLSDKSLPSNLIEEGEMMLESVLKDFECLPYVDIYVLRDIRLSTTRVSDNNIIVNRENSVIDVIDRIYKKISALLIIAPESNNLLASLCQRYESKLLLLNSTSNAVNLTSNKLNTYEYFERTTLDQIPTYHQKDLLNLNASRYVLKPIDGAGCEEIYFAENHDDLAKQIASNSNREFVIQPYISGIHASLSIMCWNGECMLLSVNEQIINEENESFKLVGCKVNALDRKHFEHFSNEICKAIPGLKGYVGVDILISKDRILLVEINPRITVSYTGISDALGINPAEIMLQCFLENKLISFRLEENKTITINIEKNCAA